MRRLFMFAALGLAFVSLALGSTYAEPPVGIDTATPIAKWFQALRFPDDSRQGCCGYHRDCWETDAQLHPDGWWALYHPSRGSDIPGRWIKVPSQAAYDIDDVRLPDHFNMAVKAVLCAEPHIFGKDPPVYCFVPPARGY
jgi:hypothetical protein